MAGSTTRNPVLVRRARHQLGIADDAVRLERRTTVQCGRAGMPQAQARGLVQCLEAVRRLRAALEQLLDLFPAAGSVSIGVGRLHG